jgi:hypothetical protein
MKIVERRGVLSVCCSLLFLFLVSSSASFAASSGDSWEFTIVPYGWLAGQEGTVSTLPSLPPADIDVSFSDDILGNIQGALMLMGEARKGSFGFTADVAYTDIESDAAIPGENFTTLTSQSQSWIVSAAGFYRFLEKEQVFLDVLAGVRYWSVDTELTLGGSPGGAFAVDNREDWFDPIVGLKGLTMLGSSKFYVNGFILIGGFGAGSDFMWDGNLNLGYQWTETISTTIGYRYLAVDYENDDFLYDVSQDGPILGLSWRF